MPLTALFVVLISALLHASWNAIVKAGDDHLISAWGTMAGAAILGLPFLVIKEFPSAIAVLIALSSGVLHMVYNLTLARSYDHGDLSLVYPIARGTAPMLATLGAAGLFHEALSDLAYVGIMLITGGILSMGILGHRAASPLQAIGWAILTGICIASYTLVDREGIHLTSPLSYIAMIFAFQTTLLSVYIRWRRSAWPWLLVGSDQWWMFGTSGFFSLAAYLLVLFALAISRVGYVAALRETSVLFASWLGWRRFSELQGPYRLWASGIVAAGLVILVAFR